MSADELRRIAGEVRARRGPRAERVGGRPAPTPGPHYKVTFTSTDPVTGKVSYHRASLDAMGAWAPRVSEAVAETLERAASGDLKDARLAESVELLVKAYRR